MSIGLLNEYFNETEADYRQERLSTEVYPKPRPRREHHLHWPLHRESARSRRRRHAVAN